MPSGTVRKMGPASVAVVWTLLLQTAGAAGGAAGGPPELLLATGGRAQLPIVVAEKADHGTRQIADELADYLSRISGARFEVQTGDGSRGIVLGTLAEFPIPSWPPDWQIRNTYDGQEAYAIRTEPQRLLLIGATELGVSHAAFRLLEALGCRWFFPAKEWEIVPAARR